MKKLAFGFLILLTLIGCIDLSRNAMHKDPFTLDEARAMQR